MTEQLFVSMERYMHACMQDAAHDTEHVYRVLYNALDIAGHEADVDWDVLVAACLLHDVGRGAEFRDPAKCHAQEGARLAEAFLLEAGCGEEFAARVAACVRTHRFRGANGPASTEAKILFDADKLDVTGAMGIARTLLYSGHENLPLYTLDERGQPLDGRTETERDTYTREYHRKLAHNYDHFFTRRATEIAAVRRPLFDAFYEALLAEARFGRTEGEASLRALLQ